MRARVAELNEQVAVLAGKLADLEKLLGRKTSNSSKPPIFGRKDNQERSTGECEPCRPSGDGPQAGQAALAPTPARATWPPFILKTGKRQFHRHRWHASRLQPFTTRHHTKGRDTSQARATVRMTTPRIADEFRSVPVFPGPPPAILG